MAEVDAETAKVLAEVIETADGRAILVTIPPQMKKRDYEALYDKIADAAKRAHPDTALIGMWPVGGHD